MSEHPGVVPSVASQPVSAAEDLAVHITANLDLVDHHCHYLSRQVLSQGGFEALLGESHFRTPPGCSAADTGFGLAVRTFCPPLLDLPACAGISDYVERRAQLGVDEVHRRLLAGGASTYLLDTGYLPDRPQRFGRAEELAAWSGGSVAEVARLETLAERVAARLGGIGGGVARSSGYADALSDAMGQCGGALGWKSVAAYRCGLGIDWSRPSPGRVREAAAEWLSAGPDIQRGWRLEHPVLIAHGLWSALDTGRPVQIHTGFGDNDIRLKEADPTLLDPLLRATADGRSAIMLLHCWPYHRQAGYLAQVWPQVYMDVGLAVPHVGSRSAAVLAQALELAPWHKMLYSSDAFGLAEIYHLAVHSWRRALATALAPLAAAGFHRDELVRLGSLVSSENARRVYGIS